MPSCGGRKSRIQQIKGANHFGFGVRQQREFDPRIAGEMFDRRNRIIADRGDAVTERMESLDFFIPGDRLGLAGNSPIEGARKQNDQAAPPRQGFEIAVLAALRQQLRSSERWTCLLSRSERIQLRFGA